MIRIPPPPNLLQVLGTLLLCNLLSLPVVLTQYQATSANKEKGLPFVQNFSPEDYNVGGQNFAIIQDQRGFIYAANNGGVLEYDGVRWPTFSLSNAGVALSLAVDGGAVWLRSSDNERIY